MRPVAWALALLTWSTFLAPAQPLLVDTLVTIGRLQNGLTYYIRENRKPEQRAELRLVVNAGSVLEDEHQSGLAHFLEHMAFNGTRNFPKKELVNYLESLGMRFGPDLNAYTSFDETVYMLTIPTDSAHVIDRAFDILEDWAWQMSLDGDEIDRERGVVIEEWRSGRGAEARIFDKQFPILLKNSRYADRSPIGRKEILESFPHDALRSFYSMWYRPDLMAVLAVGDFNKEQLEQKIKKHFSHIPLVATPTPRPYFAVPEHQEPLFAIASDREAAFSNVSVYYKHETRRDSTLQGYRRLLTEVLYNAMFNNRLAELVREADAPLLGAYSSKGSFVRTRDIYSLGAVVKDNGIERGLEALLTEAARVRKFGFTSTELERSKKEMLRSMEQQYFEREKTESRTIISEYIRNYLTGEPIPGVPLEYELHKQLLPLITLDEVNGLAIEWITNKNRVVLVSGPDKAGVALPTEQQLAGVFAATESKQISAYVDRVSSAPLVATPPTPGTIVARNERKELGITEWTLSNGVRVVLKPTDFKNDEVIFGAFSPGGHSLVADEDHTTATMASSLIQESGVGTFDKVTLEKQLAGKSVSVSPYIAELEEGLGGSAAPGDMETMFQLIHLYFTAPRADSSAFLSYRERLRGILQNRSARPEAAFEDTIAVTMSQYHQRRRPPSEGMLKEMNLQRAFAIYRDRFADAGDFTFVIVGNFTRESLEPLVKTYLGGLPCSNRKESWADIGVRAPAGKLEKTVIRGVERKSQVRMIFSGPFEWSYRNRHEIQSMAGVLRIKLREALREERGGTYGVSVTASTYGRPRPEYRITIGFGCAPDRVNELVQAVVNELDSITTFTVDRGYVAKVQETQRRERETDLRSNRFWLSTLQAYYNYNEEPGQILEYFTLIESLTPDLVRSAARRYLDMNNMVKVVLMPQQPEP